MELQVSLLSKTGARRINEDACGVWSNSNAFFCVVSDGVGGHKAGDVASQLVVKEVLEWFKKYPQCSIDTVASALRLANEKMLDGQQRNPHASNMCATVVTLAINTVSNEAVWGNLGDSRLYCFRRNRIIIQTRDHSVVQSMVDAGYMSQKELRTTPARSRLIAVIGDNQNFEPLIPESMFALEEGDVFLLCTDGLWEHIEEVDMERSLEAAPSMEAWLRELESLVLACNDKSQDNYSAIAIYCHPTRYQQKYSEPLNNDDNKRLGEA